MFQLTALFPIPEPEPYFAAEFQTALSAKRDWFFAAPSEPPGRPQFQKSRLGRLK